MISKVIKRHPRLWGAVILLTSIFCMANLPHWAVVWKYPLIYYFPQHKLTIVDAKTQQPISGAIAVYVYEYSPVLGSENWGAMFLDQAGLFVYILYLIPSNLLTGERVPWLHEPWTVYLSEGISDEHGVVKMTSYGPIHRRRNSYFRQALAPVCFIYKEGYAADVLQADLGRGAARWKSFPSWTGQMISLQQLEAENLDQHRAARHNLLTECYIKYAGRTPIKELLPTTYQYLEQIKEERNQ